MTKNDERLIEASPHYAIAECGGLARVSTPYKMRKGVKMGVGFDSVNGMGYKFFSFRLRKNANNFPIYSHRMIFYLYHGTLPKFIDHVDGDPLNNNIDNLRACTHRQNMRNRKTAKSCSSKYTGVCRYRKTGKWLASISIDNTKKHLGYFTSEKDAALAYNKAAFADSGEFANLNIIEGGEE